MKSIKIVFSLVLLFTLDSCGPKCVDFEVSYEDQVPYMALVPKPVKLTYTVSESKYNRIWGDHEDRYPVIETWTYVKNTSSHGGKFSIKKTVYTDRPRKLVFEDSQYLVPGETYKFYFTKYLEHYELIRESSYDVYPPIIYVKKAVTKYKTVTKQRKCNTCVEIEGCPEPINK